MCSLKRLSINRLKGAKNHNLLCKGIFLQMLSDFNFSWKWILINGPIKSIEVGNASEKLVLTYLFKLINRLLRSIPFFVYPLEIYELCVHNVLKSTYDKGQNKKGRWKDLQKEIDQSFFSHKQMRLKALEYWLQ